MRNRRRDPYAELAEAIRREQPRCQEIPFVFFPEDIPQGNIRQESIELARKICAQCPIRLICFEYAMNTGQRFGIWGGTLPSER